ncbi:hypothetical protein RhiJN_11469 [Ceratobasidium sp. AG-Ba]|nr:hypothetical protein RhiJN_11469 [Ceratobasidium sp. AG-Ba]QRW12187.1 hypothetical protein RhiLY_11186 [Ceratobasidium sp. AG-Ba]
MPSSAQTRAQGGSGAASLRSAVLALSAQPPVPNRLSGRTTLRQKQVNSSQSHALELAYVADLLDASIVAIEH